MKMYNASIETIIKRFYLMMIAVILPFYLGMPSLALVSTILFLSALMGVSFDIKNLRGRSSN